MAKPSRQWRRILLIGVLCLVPVVAIVWLTLPRAESGYEAMAKGHYEIASTFFAADAATGDPRAQTALGNLHYLGLGTRRDFRRAAELYFAAASEGYSPAQMNLGHLYKQGFGVETDPLRAFGWYNIAHIHNDPASEYYLNQITLEYTLTPLQRSTASARWDRLDRLVAEGL